MSKYRLTQRNINSDTNFQIQIVDFDSVAEIESVEFVKQWMAQPQFVRLSKYKSALIVEQNDNTTVGIAFLKNLEGFPLDLSTLPLPEWVPPFPSV